MKINSRMILVMALISQCMLSACAGPSSETRMAYNTPDIIKVKPYTRTIFNTIDF